VLRRATIPPGPMETLFMGRRHWNRRSRERPSLLSPPDPRLAEQRLAFWPRPDGGGRAAAKM